MWKLLIMSRCKLELVIKHEPLHNLRAESIVSQLSRCAGIAKICSHHTAQVQNFIMRYGH